MIKKYIKALNQSPGADFQTLLPITKLKKASGSFKNGKQ